MLVGAAEHHKTRPKSQLLLRRDWRMISQLLSSDFLMLQTGGADPASAPASETLQARTERGQACGCCAAAARALSLHSALNCERETQSCDCCCCSQSPAADSEPSGLTPTSPTPESAFLFLDGRVLFGWHPNTRLSGASCVEGDGSLCCVYPAGPRRSASAQAWRRPRAPAQPPWVLLELNALVPGGKPPDF